MPKPPDVIDFDPSVDIRALDDIAIFEQISEDECYLHAILSDPSGVDLAEFAFVDEAKPDGCYRLYPYQFAWHRDRSDRQVDACARAVGKSERLQNRACAFHYNYPAQEHLITGPEGNHVTLVTDRIEQRISSCRLLEESVTGGRAGITHRPFLCKWASGSRTITRLPQRSGIGMKGCLSPEAQVLTREAGFVRADEVQVGWHVWSHLQRWTTVTRAEFFDDPDSWLITGAGAPPVRTSYLHRVLVRERIARIPEKGRSGFGPPYWESVDVIAEDPERYWWCQPAAFRTRAEAGEPGLLAGDVELGRQISDTFPTPMLFVPQARRLSLLTGFLETERFVPRGVATGIALLAHTLGKEVTWTRGDDDHWRIRESTGPGLVEQGLRAAPIESVEPADNQRLVNLVTDTHSYLADGVHHHNTHPVIVDIDEAQDFPELAWKEVPEILRDEVPGHMMLCHGVSKGVQDDFFRISTRPELGYKVHQFSRVHRPGWTPEEREKSIADYGGSDENPDYLRNVHGEHAGTMHRIFHLGRLYKTMAEEQSEYSQSEYTLIRLRVEPIDDLVRARRKGAGGASIEESSDEHAQALRELCVFNPDHLARYDTFWAGMDVGLVGDPSEILIAAEYIPSAEERRADKHLELAVPPAGLSRLKIVCRINVLHLPGPLQEELVMHVIDFYKPRAFSMDSTGNGLPIFQGLQKRAGTSRLLLTDYSDGTMPTPDPRAQQALTKVKGYSFGGKVVAEIDEAKAEEMIGADPAEVIEKCGVKRWMKDISTDFLRALVDDERWLMPHDPEMLDSLNAQTWANSQEPIDAYGNRRRTYSGTGQFHILDAARCLAIGRALEPLEQFAKTRKQRVSVIDRFGV